MEEDYSMIFLLSITIVTTVLTGVIIVFFVTGKKKQDELYLNLKIQRGEHEKALITAQLQIQELTFQLISIEIHDNVNNTLLASKLQLDSIQLKNDEESGNKIKSSSTMIGESINILEDISKSLNGETMKDIGLLNSINARIQRINSSEKIKLKSRVFGKITRLTPQNELQLFRIVQESINNIIKHSKASSASIILGYYPDHLTIIVRDDGIGFNYLTDKEIIKGSGLRTMMLRIKKLNGKLEIRSSPEKGTSIIITLPYEVPQ